MRASRRTLRARSPLRTALRDWLGDASRPKLWHNYSFDRHVLANWPCRVDVQGLGGDTMHMARLWDTARAKAGLGGYSLAALTETLLDQEDDSSNASPSAAHGASGPTPRTRKLTMKELFGQPKLKKDGTPGKEVEVPTQSAR